MNMKISNEYGSKERLFEMMNKVNKVHINENFYEENNQSLDSENALEIAFDDLKNNKLNVQHSGVQTVGNDSYVELTCSDNEKNTITFVFKAEAVEGDVEGVYDMENAILSSFTFDNESNNQSIEMNEIDLKTFNAQHSNEIMDVVSNYVDFENEVPEMDEEYQDAVKKIDSYPFGGGSTRMQTSKNYGDQKPTNSNVRVKSDELDKFVDEDNEEDFVDFGSGEKNDISYKPSALFNRNFNTSKNRYKDEAIKRAKEIVDKFFKENEIDQSKFNKDDYVGMIREISVQEYNHILGRINEDEFGDFPNMKKDDIADKTAEKSYNDLPVGSKISSIMIAVEDVNRMLKNKGIDFRSFNEEEKEEYVGLIRDKAKETYKRNLTSLNEDPDYPDEIGKKFKVKSDYPKQSKKIKKAVKIDEDGDDSDDGMTYEPEVDTVEKIAQDKEESGGDVLSGGKGDDKSPLEFDPDQVLMGMKVEMEHTSDPMISLEIVMDHLTEDPEYYTVKDTPEASAQAGASKDAAEFEDDENKSEDDNLTDVLLGYKPKNV